MQLRQLFELIRKWFWLIVLAALIGAAAGLAVNHFLPKKYQAAATIFVTTPNHMDENALLGAQQAAKALASIPSTRPILEAALQKTGAKSVSETQLVKMVAVQNDLDSQYVVIQVTDSDPVRAAALTASIARLSIDAFEGTAANGTSTKFLLNEMAALQDQIKSQERQLAALERQPATTEQTNQINQLSTTLNDLRQQYSQDVNTYDQLTNIQATLVQDAQVPQNPIGLAGPLSALLGLLISQIAIAGVIIIVEQSDDVLRTPEKVEKASGLTTFMTLKRLPSTIKQLPWLGSFESDSEITIRIKPVSALAKRASSLQDADRQDEAEALPAVLTKHQPVSTSRDHLNGRTRVGSHYVLPEAFLALGVLLKGDTNNHRHTPERYGRTMQVTSPENGDGKTLVASQIALGLARIGTKVVLIDTNLRSPQIHKIFGVTNGIGLSTILYTDKVRDVDGEMTDTLRGALHPTGEPNLMILPSGPVIEAAPVLLSSPRMAGILGQLSREAFVIIDSPAVLTASEATILASRSDDILLVVNARRTTAARLNQCLRMLSYLQAPVRGVVLNQARKSGRDT